MTRRLPAAMLALTLLLAGGAVWLERASGDLSAVFLIGILLTLLGLVGATVAARLPSNPVGWLMSTGAVVIALHLFVTGYANHAFEVSPSPLWGRLVAAWMSLWVGGPAVSLFVAVLLLFPTGRLLSTRWRPLLWALSIATLLVVSGYAVKPGPIDNIPSVSNPVRFRGGAALFSIADTFAQATITFVALAAVVSLFIRMRRSRGTERQQLKWFVYAVAVFPLFFVTAMATDALLDAQLGPGDHYVDFLLVLIGATLIPVAMGVSILRYRLYDIDLIVNRTLVYGALTALLAGAYLGIVVLLQRILAPVTADSDIAVASSTLAVAALFRPLRGRVQAFIDRRFYRRKYDAAQALGDFSGRLRDEIGLESLSRDILSVVGETLQPRHASLWLRTGAPR